MWSSPASWRRPGVAAGLLVATGLLLAACASPATAARLALRSFLADVKAHSVVYAYTLLTNPAESATPFLPFFNGVKAARASYRVGSCREINPNQVTCQVTVTSPGAPPRVVQVQMLEEGNAGDWLVAAPFTTRGAAAIRLFQ